MVALRKPVDNLDGISLEALVNVALRTRAEQVFMRAPARRAHWTGDEARDLTARSLDRDADRLAGLFALSRLPARSQALIYCPLGPEAVISVLAARRAGYRACFLPLSASFSRLQGWLDKAGPSLAITITRCGDLEPAKLVRDAAARSFNARLVCAFGPHAPDGVVPLGPVLASATSIAEIDAKTRLLEPVDMVAETSWGDRQQFSEPAVLDAAIDLARHARLGPHVRIISLMMGVTAGSLASGPYLSLLTGAELLALGQFSLSALWAGLADGKQASIVAPDSLERQLDEAGIIGHQSVNSVIFLHRRLPTTALKAPAGAPRMVDLVPTPMGTWVAVERSAA